MGAVSGDDGVKFDFVRLPELPERRGLRIG